MVILRFAMKKPRDDSYLGNDRENLNKRIPAKKIIFSATVSKIPLVTDIRISVINYCCLLVLKPEILSLLVCVLGVEGF